MVVVLVTGGTGLVGKAIQDQVRSCENNVFYFASTKDGDLRNREATRALFGRINPNWVIHLAARVGGVFANMAKNLDFFEDNLAINSNVVKVSHECKIERAVFCLSTCIFPQDVSLPMNETHLHLGPPHASNEGYAYAKRMMECQVRYYRETYGYVNWVCVSPTNVYGPFDNFHEFNSHVLPALIRRCTDAVDTWVVWGSGKPRRQFIFSTDLARLILRILAKDDLGNIGHVICADSVASEVSIADLAHMVAEVVGFKGEILFDNSKPDGIYRKTVSNETLLGWFPNFEFTPLREGLVHTCTWYKTATTLRL